MPDTERIIEKVLAEWKAGVDSHDAARVAAVFTDDAIFQGLHPHTIGRQGVLDYYDAQPAGLSVEFSFHATRRPADNVALGYLRTDFARPDGKVIPLNLSVLLDRGGDERWRISFYQVSPVMH
jgi:uncharacterized protein (TIGR02246 family)